MLTNVIEQSITAIQNKKKAQESKQSVQAFSSALAYLSLIATQLIDTLDCMDAVLGTGISSIPILHAEMRNELLAYISDCGQGVHEGTLRRDTVKILETQVKAAKAELDSTWHVIAAAYSDGPRGYLSMLGGLTDTPQKAKELQTIIADSVNASPTKKSVKVFAEDVSKAKSMTSGFSLQPEIETFLKKVKEQNATIDDLSPEVLDWLKDKKLTRKLSIKF